jgi:hypothetical protein
VKAVEQRKPSSKLPTITIILKFKSKASKTAKLQSRISQSFKAKQTEKSFKINIFSTSPLFQRYSLLLPTFLSVSLIKFSCSLPKKEESLLYRGSGCQASF